MFCSQAPLFRGKCQFASPTLRKSGPHTPTWKKVECPPGVYMGLVQPTLLFFLRKVSSSSFFLPFFLIPNLFCYVYLFILRHFCHRPAEIRMFLIILPENKLCHFFRFLLPFWRIWRNSDVTWKLLVLIVVDMDKHDKGDQDLYIGTKYSIIAPLLFEIYGGVISPR